MGPTAAVRRAPLRDSPRFADLPRSERDEPLGAFANWYLALAELVMRSPRAEAYFMVQDDVVFARGVRPFLERAL